MEGIRVYGDANRDCNNRVRFGLQDALLLHRTYSNSHGIVQLTFPEENLDKWFRAWAAAPPHPSFPQACLYYHPRTFDTTVKALEGRFALILSTPSQRDVAWRYGHRKQVLMNGRIGQLSSRTFVFTLTVISNRSFHIPIAYILFGGNPGEREALHMESVTDVLSELLQRFKTAMGLNDLGEEFQVRVALTESLSQWDALSAAWPGVRNLLCILSVSRAWCNELNRCISRGPVNHIQHSARKRLGLFAIRQ